MALATQNQDIDLNYKKVFKQTKQFVCLDTDEKLFFGTNSIDSIYVKQHKRDGHQLINSDGCRCFYSLSRKLYTGDYLELFLFVDIPTNSFIQNVLSGTTFINSDDPLLKNLNKRWLNTLFDYFLSIS
jgi:hypothetical protein